MISNNLADQTVAQVVSDNIKAAHVFKKYGIDFCCGGGISVQKACEKKNLDTATVCDEIAQSRQKGVRMPDYQNWSLPFLIDYIVNTHHVYVTESIHILNQYVEKVARVHGEHHPPLLDIRRLYHQLADELSLHLQKEETVLFPYVKSLAAAQQDPQTAFYQPPFGTVNNPIALMRAEHDTAGEICKEIADLTEQYQTPEWACNTFKALYAKLQEFEEDLHIHVHLENNILFPKAILLEKEVLATTLHQV